MLFAVHQIALKQQIFQSVLMFLAGGVNLTVCHVLLTGFRMCSFPCNGSQICGCLHTREACSELQQSYLNYVKAYGCDLVIKNKVSSKQIPGEVFVCSAKGL